MACGGDAATSVAGVLRDHAGSLRLSHEQGKAAAHIMACRTHRLGGHIAVCNGCGRRHFAYHSCRDRHCPRCGGLDQALWAEAQQQHLLPLSYFHLVFTVPASLRPFFFGPGRAHAFDALFDATSETILDVAARDGLTLGVLAVLHTWNQRLDSHPHVHCLVPGGGFDGSGALVVMPRFLYSYKRLRHVFRIKLLQKLRVLVKQRALNVSSASAHHLLDVANRREWNVHAKRSLAGPDAVIKYFARYTKRIAISDSRLAAYDGRSVTYNYRDRRDYNRVKQTTVAGASFARKFLAHIVPPRFVRIRRYGFLSNRVRRTRLAQARQALSADAPPPPRKEPRSSACLRIFGTDPTRCTKCPDGRLVVVARWTPTALPFDVVLANILPRAP